VPLLCLAIHVAASAGVACRRRAGDGNQSRMTSLEDRYGVAGHDVLIRMPWSRASDEPRLTASALESSWHLARVWPTTQMRDLPLRRSFHGWRPTAAFLARAGFLVVWLTTDVRGFRSVLARGWHEVYLSLRTTGALLLGWWWRSGGRRMLRVADVSHRWGGLLYPVAVRPPVARSMLRVGCTPATAGVAHFSPQPDSRQNQAADGFCQVALYLTGSGSCPQSNGGLGGDR
jgi:hypothetical protein